jgi:spermidine synthase
MILFVDGAAGTPMYNLKAILESPEEQAHLLFHFGEFFPFWFLEKEEKETALIIGPGGGRDVVISLLGGVESITAVEVNPEIVQLVEEYEEFNGGIYTRIPNVKVAVDEGRKFLRSNAALYDLIMMALPVTKSSRSVEGYALTENYLYTVESMGDYLDHLTPEGRIVIVAHSNAEIYRLVVLAIEALEARGIDERNAMQHIYTLASGMMPTIVIKKEPFTLQEVELRHSRIHELGFDQGNFYVPFVRQVHLRPDERLGVDSEWRMFDQVLVDISTGQLTVSELIKAASIDITAATDDRPFFLQVPAGLTCSIWHLFHPDGSCNGRIDLDAPVFEENDQQEHIS